MSLKAVIWDFGGVFTTSPFEAFNRYEEKYGLPKDFIRGVNATNPDSNAWARFERAELDGDGFDLAFAEDSKALGHEVRGGHLLPLINGDLRPAMVRALDACKSAGLKNGLITNNFRPNEPGEQKGVGGHMNSVLSRFDEVIESSKAGVRKPDPRIYAMMCDLLKVAASECVYLDDLGINLKPARAMGMTTIKVLAEKQALDDLSAATGLKFS
jgi:putative hydrolase of the HAD superfamily